MILQVGKIKCVIKWITGYSLKIIDRYIIVKYLSTFLVMLMMFIPIGIMVDMAEKIDKFKENEVPINAIVDYYYDFTWYFANLLFPIFLFLAVIWFTSKLANNTEVIALLSSGISFNRFIRPFMISASIVAIFAFFAGMHIVPKSNQRFNEFRFKYIDKTVNEQYSTPIANKIKISYQCYENDKKISQNEYWGNLVNNVSQLFFPSSLNKKANIDHKSYRLWYNLNTNT